MAMSLEMPCNPHLAYMGMYAMGAPGIGFNCAGRLTSYEVTFSGANVTIVGNAESITPDYQYPHIKSFYNGVYCAERQKLHTTVTRLTPRSDIIFDAIPLPESANWRSYPGPFCSAQKRNLLVEWDGDANTERYRIYHALESDYSDARIFGAVSANSVITVTNTSVTLADIDVTGVDGAVGPEGNYTISITRAYADADITIVITDNVESSTSDSVTWDGAAINFGRGLVMNLDEDTWPDTGTTVFTVTAEPNREYLLRNPTDATHYFKVRALRDTDNTYADSAWESKTIVNPPDPVSNIDVDFASTTSVNITFTMPSDADIVGFHIFLGEYWKNGNKVPHWYPRVTASAGPSEEVIATITGLTTLRSYWFYVRAFDSSGMDDETTNVSKFFLSSTAVSYGDVEAPNDITAEATDLQEVTLTVTTDKQESSINIYWDSGTGTIDWSTIYANIASSFRVDRDGNEFGTYISVLTGIVAGTYLFGARCEANGANDGGEDVYDDVTVYDVALTAPSSVTISEVASNG